MEKTIKHQLPKVSVVIPMRNASSTIVYTLDGLRVQTYPIEKIVIVDNASTDNSVEVVKKYAEKYKKINIQLLINKADIMIARSIVRGAKEITTPYIIFTQADIRFVTAKELHTLMEPIIKDPSVIATFGSNENPLSVWNNYPFWEKVLFAYDTGKRYAPGFYGKIDCIKADAYWSIGGHGSIKFKNYGCEDADLHLRLKNKGKIVATKARSQHIHYLFKDFSLYSLFWKKKFTASGYGKLLRIHGLRKDPAGMASIFVKPMLAIGSLIPLINIICIPLLVIFPFYYYKRMFITPSTLRDPRILLLPFVGIILVYYETFWTFVTFLEKVDE